MSNKAFIQSSELAPEPEIVIDPIIRVDRLIHPSSYPNWMEKIIHPELQNVGPPEYNITEIQQWLHSGQKNGGSIKGSQIYADLKETDDIKNHFVLRDLEEIKKKGIAFFRKYFAGKIVFAWGSVVSFHGTLLIPCLCENGDSVIFVWRWLDLVWKSLDPGLRHVS